MFLDFSAVSPRGHGAFWTDGADFTAGASFNAANFSTLNIILERSFIESPRMPEDCAVVLMNKDRLACQCDTHHSGRLMNTFLIKPTEMLSDERTRGYQGARTGIGGHEICPGGSGRKYRKRCGLTH